MIQTQALLSDYFSGFKGVVGSPSFYVPNKFPPYLGVNLTSNWFKENWKDVQGELRGVLEKKFPRSSQMGLLEDHLQNFILKMVKGDYLAPYIRKGNVIKSSVLCAWLRQSVTSEIRCWGTDASLRTSRRALTTANRRATEASNGLHQSFRSAPTTYTQVVTTTDNGEMSLDIADMSMDMEDAYAFKETLEAYEMAVRERLSDDHVRVMGLLLEGSTYDEISAVVGKKNVHVMVDAIRKTIRNTDMHA